MKGPRPIAELLEHLLKSTGGGLYLPYRLSARWQEIVGSELAGRCLPRRFSAGTLTVAVSNHAWIQQLQFLKPRLLEQIRSHLGTDEVREIRFAVGKISAS